MLQTGAQLYTVRSYTQTIEDFTCTIQKIADIGYKAVQLSAVSKQIKPEQIREICDHAGISIVLTHSDPERILHDTDALIKEHDILGCSYIGLGCMPDKYRTKEWLSHFISDFKEPAKKIAASGKLFMYHNHNLEFETFAAENLPNARPTAEFWNISSRALHRMKWESRSILTGLRQQARTSVTGSRR